MDFSSVAVPLIGGCAAGFLAGFFGIGGGIILVPFLIFYGESLGVSSLVSTHVAFGTSLLVLTVSSLFTTYSSARSGHVIRSGAMVCGAASALGAGLGSIMAGSLEGKTLQRIFALVVTVAIVGVLSELRRPKGSREVNLRIPALAGTGLAVGVLAALSGGAGGMFSIPIMYTTLRFPLQRAIGTSGAIIAIASAAATVAYVLQGWGNPLLPADTLGYVYPLQALSLIVGMIPSAVVGARMGTQSTSMTLRRIFAALLVIMAFKMLLP
jgi:hypothetical protein